MMTSEQRQHPDALPVIPVSIFPQHWIENRHIPQPGEVLISITEPEHPPVTPFRPYAAIYHLEDWNIPFTIVDHPQGPLIPLREQDAQAPSPISSSSTDSHDGSDNPLPRGHLPKPRRCDRHQRMDTDTANHQRLIQQYPAFNRRLYRTLCQAALTAGLLRQ